MKKLLVFLCASLLLGNTQHLKAQCYGTVAYDASVNGNGASTFTLTTANANEMILISLDGYSSTQTADPGPVTVDGNNATLINSAMIGNSGSAEVWAYPAPAAGAHTIVCPETNLEAPYYLNFAAAFYTTGSCTPLSISNLTSVENTVTDSTGGVIFNSITTTAPNSIVYCDAEMNTGKAAAYPVSWANANLLADLHEGNGLDCSDAYESEATAGTYTIEAKNLAPYTGGGGLDLILVAITPPACGVTVTAAVGTNPSCGSNNGSATATATGGTTPYTYAWTPSGGTNATASGLSAGTYTVTVTDNLGCTGTASVTLTATSSITSTVTSTNILCSGGNTGTATVTATGGTTPYTYLWNPGGETTQTATGLSIGTYTVTVTDANGCNATNSVTISQPPLLNASTSSTTATCGQNNGSATVTVTGGTSPYTYLWNPGGGTTATISNISAGTYTVTVFDSNGCNVNAAVTVANSSGINTSITAFTDVLCNGFSTGSATVTATGGTTPYTYSWSPSGGTNATATGLSAGTYTVTVTDANGCNTPAIAIITQPKPVRDSISSITYPLCNGGTGSATVGVKGGVSPYTYSWAPSGGTNATATGLTAGTYTITVHDNNGCLSTVTVIITQPTPITGTYTTTPTTCGNNNGTITANISGGTTPYTYLWNPGGQTNSTATGLSVGTYTLIITDNNGCSRTGTATITALSSPTVTVTSSTNDKCNGNSNGSATVSVSGGTSPYTYSWAPGGSTTATESNLSAGTYTITVHDSSGCVATTTVTITQPAPITGTITTTGVLCNSGSTGTATVTVSGGNSPYTYLWTPGGQTNQTATGLSAGSYSVTITDKNGCTGTASTIITQPAVLTDSISAVTYPTCNGGTGTATVGVTGGTTPYTYLWNPGGQTNTTATGLSAGTYTVTVTDKNGCTKTSTVTITQPAPIIVTTTTTQATCGNNNGTATANVSGGSTPYTYVWSSLPPQTNATATGLSVGTYTVVVVDKNGCDGTSTATITAINSPTIMVVSTTNDKCNGNSNGSATVSVTGGSSPYTYLWTPGGYTTASVSTLSAGTYTVTVRDSNGCIASINLTITQPAPVNVTATSTGVACNGGSTGTATAAASGGTTPYTYLWNPSGQTNITATGLSAGTYTVIVTDNNGCTGSATVLVTQPTAIKDTITSITYPLCNAGTGSATIGVSGGTPVYTYLWTPGGGTNATETGLTVGTYTITVKDNNGCSATNVIVAITQPAAITLTTHINPTPCGDSTGLAWVSVSGGTGPYTYLWNPTGQTHDSALNLSAGTYTFTVTDKNGCNQTATATVTTTTSIVLASGGVTGVLCNGGSTGSATVNASGGTSPYTYQWAPGGGTNATESGLSAGIYTVTVTDSRGCNNTITFTITQPNPLVATPVVNNITCNGFFNGNASVTPTGGTSPYTYAWSPVASTTSSVTGLGVGSFTLVVTDANGCSVTSTFNITQPTALTVSTSSTNASCTSNNGTATVTAGGGTAPYTYNWNPSAQTNTTATGLSAGVYTVTVTDNNGCTITDTVTVHNTSTLSITATNTNELCNGASTATASVTATGGTTPYTYAWTPGGQTNATATGLSAGIYTITVTDNAGCNQFAVVTITQPAAIVPTTTTTGAGCSNNTGSATVTATGGTGAYTYSWAPGGGTTATISGLGSGAYTVTVTDANGCSETVVANVASGGVSGSITAVTNVACFGNNTGSATVTAVGNATPFTYLWTPGGQTNATASGLSEGSYTVTVTDNNGCSFTASVTITGPASALTATISSANASCSSTNNGSVTLTVSGGTPQYTYSWSNSSTTQNLSNLLPGTYSVTVTDSGGCSLTESVTVGADTSVFAHAGNDTVICHNSTIELNGTSSVNATGYAWYQMPGMVLLKDSSVVFVTPTNDTTTYVLVVSHGNCTDTGSVTIVTLPALSVNPGPDQVIYGTGTVTLGGTPTNPSGTSVVWEPSSTLNDSIYANPASTPTVTTIYTVTVSNAAGCKASDTVTVFVLPGINPPSGFTPNGDGTNDYWVLPFAPDFPNIEVEVYNRWGELLFHSDGYNTPWDGTYNGKPVPVGTYYYIINLNDSRFPKAMTGSVTIMR